MSACWALGRCQMLVSARSGPRVGSARPDRERTRQTADRERAATSNHDFNKEFASGALHKTSRLGHAMKNVTQSLLSSLSSVTIAKIVHALRPQLNDNSPTVDSHRAVL